MSTATIVPRSDAPGARRPAASCPRVNVAQTERLASLVGGGVLAAIGLSRRSPAGLLLGAIGASLAWRGWTGHCNVYQALGVSTAEQRPQTAVPSGQGIKISESITILRPQEELYGFWRRLENLPRVMQHLVSVKELDGQRSHWIARGPGFNAEWDAEIITERPNELIGWKSLPGSMIDSAGSVHFVPAPGNRGTEVRIVLSYSPPAGRLGHVLAWLTGHDAATELREDMRKFKCLMETGSLPTTDGQPRGQCVR
jgi:uncharacterized membrane protein